MRWRSDILPTGCAAASPLCSLGRGMSVCSRAPNAIELQQLLAQHGYDVGEPDGRLGAKTRVALRQFPGRNGLVPDGFASATILDHLRRR